MGFKYCCAPGCYNSTKTNRDGVAFHRFPKDEKLCLKWLQAINWKVAVPTQNHFVCSKHFVETSLRGSKKHTRILGDAVPTIFHNTSSETEEVNKPLSVDHAYSKGERNEFGENLKSSLSKPPVSEATSNAEKQDGEGESDNECAMFSNSPGRKGHATNNNTDQMSANILYTLLSEIHDTAGIGEDDNIMLTSDELSKENSILVEDNDGTDDNDEDDGDDDYENVDDYDEDDDDDDALTIISEEGEEEEENEDSNNSGTFSAGSLEWGEYKMCRTCGGPGEISIYEEEGIDMQLGEKINAYLPIMVSKDDVLPLALCDLCVQRLESYHELISSCTETDEKLRKALDEDSQLVEENLDCGDTDKMKIDDLIDEGGPRKIVVDDTVSHKKNENHNRKKLTTKYYSCSKCPKKFVLARHMKKHMFLVHSEYVYECFKCELKCSTKYEFDDHFKRCHFEEGHYTCHICGAKFSDVDDVVGHANCDETIKKPKRLSKMSDKLSEMERAEHFKQYFTNWYYKCHVCKERLESTDTAVEHLNECNGTIKLYFGRYRCYDCDRECRSKLKLLSHFRSHIKENGCLVCPFCECIFESAVKILEHSDCSGFVKYAKELYTCIKCGTKCRTPEDLESHLLTHFDCGRYTCEICEKTYHSPNEIMKNVECDNTNRFISNSFACLNCKSTFSSRNELLGHLEKHFKDGYFDCGICGAKFDNTDRVLDHYREHDRSVNKTVWTCRVCEKTFKSHFKFTYHMLSHKTVWECDKCGKNLSNKKFLELHLMRHSGEFPFVCQYCSKRYTSLFYLKQHERLHERVTKTYPCNVCDKVFKSKFLRSQHVVVHTGERSYVCATCGKAFCRQTNLNQHQYTHLKEPRFRCEVCDRGFLRRANLTLHLRTHTGERPYKCPVCGRGFAQNGDMKKHTATHYKPAGTGVRNRNHPSKPKKEIQQDENNMDRLKKKIERVWVIINDPLKINDDNEVEVCKNKNNFIFPEETA